MSFCSRSAISSSTQVRLRRPLHTHDRLRADGGIHIIIVHPGRLYETELPRKCEAKDGATGLTNRPTAKDFLYRPLLIS